MNYSNKYDTTTDKLYTKISFFMKVGHTQACEKRKINKFEHDSQKHLFIVESVTSVF